MQKMLIVAIIGALILSCGSSERPEGKRAAEKQEADTLAKVYGADSARLSENDVKAFVEFEKLCRRWNVVIAPLVRDFLDPNMSAEEWVKGAGPIIQELRAAHQSMMGYAMSMEDKGLRKTFLAFAENYRAKLHGLTALHMAVANGDTQGQEAAMQAIGKAASEGNAIAMEIADKIQGAGRGNVILEEWQKRQKEIDDAVKKK